MEGKQLSLFEDFEPTMDPSTGLSADVPFVNEVETFNATFGKPNNYEPTIPEKKEWQFVYDFIQEELILRRLRKDGILSIVPETEK
jgi:hypothetical protein